MLNDRRRKFARFNLYRIVCHNVPGYVGDGRLEGLVDDLAEEGGAGDEEGEGYCEHVTLALGG